MNESSGRVVAVPAEASLLVHIRALAVNAHGQPLVITRDMEFPASGIMIGFRCGKGCFHEWRLVEIQTPQGKSAAWMEGMIVLPPELEEATEDEAAGGESDGEAE